MEIMLVFVGSVFLLISSVMYYINWKYRKEGEIIDGKVVAIEKYVSRSVSSRGRSSQLMYRPIYEYFYEGKPYWFYTSSKNTISHKINQKVKLLKLPGGPEYVLPVKNVFSLFSTVFGLFGVFAWAFFFFSDHSLVFKITGVCVVLTAIFLGFYWLRSKFPQLDFFKEILKSNHLVTRQDLEDRQVFWAQSEVDKEVAFIGKVGIWIALGFMAFAGGLTYLCWHKMDPQVKAHLMEVGFEFSRWPEFKGYFPREGELMGFLFGIVFFLMSLHSLVYALYKR